MYYKDVDVIAAENLGVGFFARSEVWLWFLRESVIWKDKRLVLVSAFCGDCFAQPWLYHNIMFLVCDGVYFCSVYAEGVVIAASHPAITSVAAGAGLGLLVLQSAVIDQFIDIFFIRCRTYFSC